MTLWTVTHQAPLSLGISRQEYWSGLLCSPPGNLPNPGTEPESLTSSALVGGFLTTSTPQEDLDLYNQQPDHLEHFHQSRKSPCAPFHSLPHHQQPLILSNTKIAFARSWPSCKCYLTVYVLASDAFCSTQCFRDLFTLLSVSVVHAFLWLYWIALYDYNTVYLFFVLLLLCL